MIFLFGITASTFAWFKINSNASVSGFEFTVQGGEGYQISIDDEHYYSSLTNRQMLQAILMGYDSGYNFKNDVFYYNSNEVEDSKLSSLVKEKIQMEPVTPHLLANGSYSFRNYSGNVMSPSTGKYVEFDIYFKGVGNESDNQSYSIYVLNGDGYYNEVTGESAPGTSIKSGEIDTVTLTESMIAIDPSIRDKKNYSAGDSINVYSSNALRFSIGNENDENYPSDTIVNRLYEISDDRDYDLGSYATDYDSYCATNSIDVDSIKHKLYDCNSNAQFTYYNNLRKYSLQTPMSYATMLEFNVIRHLITEKENKDETNTDYHGKLSTQYITTVKSGEKSHKLTFRFWLEGYDADCFEGISSSIRVNLSFGSVKNS